MDTNNQTLGDDHGVVISTLQQRFGPTTTVTTIAAWFLFVVVLYARSGKNPKHFKDMDGVPIKELKGESRYTRFFQSLQLSQEGETLAQDEPYLIRNGSQKELLLHSAEQVREFYRVDGKDHFKPTNMNMGDYFGRLLGQCVGLKSGAEWKTMRKHFDPQFSHTVSNMMVIDCQHEVTGWMRSLLESNNTDLEQKSFTAKARDICGLLPFRLISKSLYGDMFDEQVFEQLKPLVAQHRAVLGKVAMGTLQKHWIYNLLPTRSKLEMDTFQAQWQAFNLRLINVARETNITCPAERIFRAVDQHGEITMDEFLQTLDEILFTNIDITTNVLAFLLNNLASDQDFQQKLRQEITTEKLQPDFDAVRYLNRQDTQLHYLCMECVRLCPAFWFSLPECTTVDKIIGRYYIPANTAVVIDVRRLNNNPLTWGPDGSAFQPARFATIAPEDYRYGFMRFGIPSGKCMGKHVAEMILKLTTMVLLQEFELQSGSTIGSIEQGEIQFMKI